MKIAITTDDIEAGRRRDPSDCPVARALRRAGISHFGVTGMLVIVQTGRNPVPLLLPAHVQDWILDFDWGSAMAPIDFELTLPDEQENQALEGKVSRHQDLLDRVEAGPEAPKTNPCTRGGLRLPKLPRLSLPARNLLGGPFRRCRTKGKARNRAPAKTGDQLVPS